MSRSAIEATFDIGVKAWKLPPPEAEFRFHPSRMWRFDRAWPALRLAVEIDGGTWIGGRHTRPAGYAEDCNKMNTAALMGWTVLRFTSDQVRRGEAYGFIAEAIRQRSTGVKSESDDPRN